MAPPRPPEPQPPPSPPPSAAAAEEPVEEENMGGGERDWDADVGSCSSEDEDFVESDDFEASVAMTPRE